MTTAPLRWLLGGFLLTQLAWVLAIPPFGGIDEFDHSFRATAVAHGQWFTEPSEATRGTGATVRVPSDVVEAATPECERVGYVPDSECHGSPTPSGDMVDVASGAGRYNPAFYAVAGTASLPFEGFSALYAMRAATIALCTLLFGLACRSLIATSTKGWGPAALVVSLTPILLYSTSVVAPNGPEMMAALMMWCGLLALLPGAPRLDRVRGRWIPVGLAIAGSGLAVFRSLGTLWLAVICTAVGLLAVLTGVWRDAWWRALRSTAARWVAVAVAAAGAAGIAWTLALGSYRVSVNEEDPVLGIGQIVSGLALDPVLWVLQSIGAFPLRNDPAPVPVYALELAVFGALLVWGARRGDRRILVVTALLAVASLLIPFVIAAASYNTYGHVWQGRYALPIALGVPLLVGLALDRSPRAGLLTSRVHAPLTLMLAVAHGWSIWHVTRLHLDASPLAGDDAWVTAPPAVLGLLGAVGVVFMCWGVWRNVDRVAADSEASARPMAQVPA